ncbi:hypothetical protein PVAND_017403 [Polypedilum vanderplanki]|uniref:C2H2-type domain-containing protein n=1 Tax=Polypedilum vanderplanki TaxID=319348 RepID=A0A9J6BI65_POLVA|nr:hypothetical protein PVAND_017403 [Polypedilum vanderplanki]
MSIENFKFDSNREFLISLDSENEQQHNKVNKKAKQIKNEKHIFCNICEKKLSSKSKLTQHMKNLHPNEITSKVYFCDQCDLKFIKKSSLVKHLKSKHQKEKEIKFECDFDGKIFDSKAKIYSHMKACHRTIEKCNLCGKKVQLLNQHMSQVHPMEDEKFQCQICRKKFKNHSYLNVHLKTHNKQHQCQLCGKKFPNLTRLKEHQKIHENQFAFRCVQCQKNFSSPSSLRTHLKTHNKNRTKKHKCQQCE